MKERETGVSCADIEVIDLLITDDNDITRADRDEETAGSADERDN